MGRIAVRGELSLDGSGWAKTLRTAEGQVQTFGQQTLGALKGQIAGAFSIGAIIGFTKSIVDAATKIKDMSEQFGISTDEVQKFGRAAEHIGLTIDDVGAAIGRLGKARKEAAQGNTGLQEMFKGLGVSYSDLQNPSLRNLDLLQKMAEAMRGLTLNSSQREDLRELFGRGGDKLAALFDTLSTMKPIEIISKEQIEAIDKASKDLSDMWKTLQAMAAKPISAAARSITETGAGRMSAIGEVASYMGPFGMLRAMGFGKFLDKYAYKAPGGDGDQGFEASEYAGGAGASAGAGPLFGYKMYSKPIGPQNYKEDQMGSKSLAADSLVRVGNFLGDAPKMVTIAEKQLRFSERTAIAAEETARNTRTTNDSDLGF